MEIRNDVPIPPRTAKYPWRMMEIGESVRIDFAADGTDTPFRKAVANAYAYQAKARTGDVAKRGCDPNWQFKSKSYRAERFGLIWRVA